MMRGASEDSRAGTAGANRPDATTLVAAEAAVARES